MPDYSGSFSGSFEGNGNKLTNIDYYSLSNLPASITPFQKNSILANNSLRDNFVSNVKTRLNAESVISSSAQLTTEFDIRYGNEVGDDLISGSAQIKTLLPSGTVSGSAQTIANLPSGVISGSAQVDFDNIKDKPVTISVTQSNAIVANTAKVGYTDAAVKSKLNSEGVFSGSAQVTINESQISDLKAYLTAVPNGTVSSSAQITITESQISNLKSYLTAVPSGTISSSAQITALGYSTTDSTGSEQSLSISGDKLTISNGNTVTLPSNDEQTLTLAGNNLSISNGNTVNLSALAGGGGGGGGSSIWNTGSQDPSSYTHLMTSNNLQVTGSVDIKGDFTVNGQSVFTQTSASDVGNAVVIKGRLEVLEEQIGSYIASASIQVGNTQDTIDCGGFF